tara:strand:+ start:77 stop:196 length:120 start_codon:yes stop_codon:yes gene_type:complete
MRKFKVQEVKEGLWEMLECLPDFIWYIGMFALGFVVGAW